MKNTTKIYDLGRIGAEVFPQFPFCLYHSADFLACIFAYHSFKIGSDGWASTYFMQDGSSKYRIAGSPFPNNNFLYDVKKSVYSFGELLKTQKMQVGLPVLCISLCLLFRGQHFLTSLLRRKGENEPFRRI